MPETLDSTDKVPFRYVLGYKDDSEFNLLYQIMNYLRTAGKTEFTKQEMNAKVISFPQISVMLAKLEKDGYIEKQGKSSTYAVVKNPWS